MEILFNDKCIGNTLVDACGGSCNNCAYNFNLSCPANMSDSLLY